MDFGAALLLIFQAFAVPDGDLTNQYLGRRLQMEPSPFLYIRQQVLMPRLAAKPLALHSRPWTHKRDGFAA